MYHYIFQDIRVPALRRNVMGWEILDLVEGPKTIRVEMD
jgi:hypothetical protein